MARQLHFNDKKYDKQQKRIVAATGLQVRAAFDAAATKACVIGFSTGYTEEDGEFHFDDYPAASSRIEKVMRELQKSVVSAIQRGNAQSWALSQRKNDDMTELVSNNEKAAEMAKEAQKKRSGDALEAFQARKTAGMNLSDRVWEYAKQSKEEFELAIEVGMGQGKSADALSRDVRNALRDPEKLFRRVRDKKSGQLRLSKAAAAYHPGRGVYRSSYKNALRMTATENNMAYRTADHLRWKETPWIVGIEVKTSINNHGVSDICDQLAGEYPKDFKFVGWHPWCRCFASPILCSDDEYDKYEDMLLEGKDVSGWEPEGKITELPEGFNTWVEENEKRIASAKSKPYFLTDNFKDGDPKNGPLWEKEPEKEASKEPEKGADEEEVKLNGALTKYVEAFNSYSFDDTDWPDKLELMKAWGGDSTAYRQAKKFYEAGLLSSAESCYLKGTSSHEFTEFMRCLEKASEFKPAADIPDFYKSRFEELQRHITNGLASGVKGKDLDKSLYLELENLVRLTENENAKRLGLDNVSTKMPEKLFGDRLMKSGVDYVKTPLNKDFFDTMPKFIDVDLFGTKNYYSLSEEKVYLSTSKLSESTYMQQKTIYHEFGHAMDNTQPVEKWKDTGSMKDFFDNNKLDPVEKQKYVKIFNEAEIAEKIVDPYSAEARKLGCASDTIQALLQSDHSPWWIGHPSGYFTEEKAKAEIIAHMSENYWLGNDLFEKYFPDLYIKMTSTYEALLGK